MTIVAYVTSDQPISSVKANLFDSNNALLDSLNLQDNGISPDTSANDGHYTGTMTHIFSCRIVGIYRIQIIAYNISNYSSPSVSNTVSVTRFPDHPPVITNLVFYPHSADTSQTINLGFMVTASDPDGPCDIQSVFYTGFHPDHITQLNRQDLFDDGSCCPIGNFPPSGDTTANDGKYTRIFLNVHSPHELGYFTYFFRAVDRSGDTSNVLADSIFIHP